MSTLRFLFFVCFFSFCYSFCHAQSQTNPISILPDQPGGSIKKAFTSASDFPYAQSSQGKKLFGKYIDSSSKKSDDLNKRIERTNRKYLKKYFKEENRLQKKFCKVNPELSDNLFSVNNDPLSRSAKS